MFDAIALFLLALTGLGFIGFVVSLVRDMDEMVMPCFLAFFVGLIGLVPVAIYANSQAKSEFMEACLKDHKQYECTAMWRAGDRRFMPMPVIIPIR